MLDFAYVEDLNRLYEHPFEDDSAYGEVLNVGSTDNVDIRTTAETIRNEINPTLDLGFDDARSGDD